MTTLRKRKIILPHIRSMIRRDIPMVLDIENESFPFPWSEDKLIQCLRQRNCIGMVSEVDDQIVGFFVYELFKTRLNILNFAVRSEHRRAGIGTAMVRKLQSKLSHERRCRITLCISESNLEGQLFFRSQGFRAFAVTKDFYECRQDAYEMEYWHCD